MRKAKIRPHLPPNPAPYLIDWLFEIGPSVAVGMGEGPLGWGDLAHWQALSGVALNAWEARTLRRLSGDWLGERHRAEKDDAPAPALRREDVEANRDAVSAKLERAFDALELSRRPRNSGPRPIGKRS